MPTSIPPSRRKSLVASTVLVPSVVCTAFVAAVVFFTPPSHGVSSTFTQPDKMAAPYLRNATSANSNGAPQTAKLNLVPEPRECDLANGIDTACLFLD